MKTKILIAFLSVWGVGRLFGQTIITDTIYLENGGFDAYTNSSATTTNYGTDTSLWVYYDYGTPSKSYYSYLKADFSTIPKSAIVTNASIHLYALEVNNTGDHPMALQRLSTAWTESTITWSSPPTGVGTDAVTMSDAETSVMGWQSYNFTGIARYQVTNPSLNYGCRILQGSYSGTLDKGVKYASTEHLNNSLRPYVVLEYLLPYTDTIYLSTTKDSRVYSGSTGTNYGADSLLSVYWDAGTNSYANRSFFYADLSGIPKSAEISRANLFIYAVNVNNTDQHPMYIESVNGTVWTENGITWANQPTVTSSNRSGINHTLTQNTGWQTMYMNNLVKYAVWSPEYNKGWRIALQAESGTNDKGVNYASAEYPDSSKRPYIVVEYFDPIVVGGYVRHCTQGNNDGAIVPTYSGGAGVYSSYLWRKLASGTITSIEQGTNMALADISGLTDGLYIFEVTDYAGIKGYSFFFVGEEGTTTDVSFSMTTAAYRAGYTEDAYLVYYKATGDSVVTGGGNAALSSYTNTTYNTRGIQRYKVEWDPSLEFTDSRLIFYNRNGHNQTATSDNDAYVSRITSPWGEYYANWATRPTISKDNQCYFPTTTVNGITNRNDTCNILPFVSIWQEDPSSNYGIELALKTYNQPASAHRDYQSSDGTTNGLLVSFTVKPKIETVFHDSLGLGDITVNAPAGELPFKYLISNVDTIPDLQVIWPFLRDSLAADSASFFAGIHNTRNYVFTDLPADRYFVSVFDNKGRRLADHQIYLKPQLTLADTTSIVISGDTLRVDSTQANSAHAVLFDGVSLEYEDGGVELEIIQFADEVIVGFNSFSLPICYYDASYEYAIRIQTNQKAYLLKRGTVLDSVNVNIGDQLRLVKNANSVEFYKGTSLLKSDYLKSSQKDDFKIEVGLKGPESALIAKPYGKVTKLPKITITPSICGENFSDVTINGSSFHGFSIVGFKLKEISASVPLYNFPNYPDPFPVILQDVPVGIYTLTTYWSNGIYTTTNQMELVVGYKVNWTDLYNLYESPYPTNSISVNTGYSNGYANSINTTDETSDFWIQFSEKIIPGSTTQTNFYLKNESGSIVGRVRIVSSSGSIYAQFYAGTSALNILSGVPYMVLPTVIQLPTTEPIRIMKTGTLYEFKYKGITVASFTDASTEKKHVFLAMAGSHVVTNIIASFCYPVASPFVQLKTTIDGGHYLANKGILNVEYDEEYNDDDLEFYVYQEAGNDEIGQSTWTASPLSNGDNRLSFDFTSTVCLDNGYYILEIVNKKNEKRYLRFKIVNSTCS